MTTRGWLRLRRTGLLVAIVVASVVSGCGGAASSGPLSTGGAPGRPSSGNAATAAPSLESAPASPAGMPGGEAPARASAGPPKAPAASGAALRPVARTAGWRLPHPVSREAALAVGSQILVLGGLASAGGSLASVLRVDPVSGATVPQGHLAEATHDAAAALFGRTAFVFGGGTVGSTAAIQSVDAASTAGAGVRAGQIVGQLPARRSDLAAVVLAGTTFLVGGWDGSRLLPELLATADGTRIRTAGELAVPVRYAATAALHGSIWLFGGQAIGGNTSVIQRFDPVSGRTSIVGRLPEAIAGASAVTLHGDVFIMGGSIAGRASDEIWRLDPGSAAVTPAGRLPYPVAYAAIASVGDVAYLLGGEGTSLLDTVVEIELASH